tara:strand:+ start:2788 stop:3201 length:414 start_codon:yes stop_codon:yes gene_type:complete
MHQALRVLHVEDDFADALLVQNAVCEAGDFEIVFEVARTLREAKRKLKTGTFDLILLDLRLPDSVKPRETYDIVSECCGETPLLVLSGSMRVDGFALPDEVPALDKNQHLCGMGDAVPVHLAGMIRNTAESSSVETI